MREAVMKAGSADKWGTGNEDIQVFLERFAHFFTEEFFVRRCFETLCAEHKPEHAGFKRACNTLFTEYRRVYGEGGGFVDEEDIVEHLYDEEIVELDVKRAARFLAWCGLLRLSDEDRRAMEGMQLQPKRDTSGPLGAAAAARRDSNGIEQFQTNLYPTLS